MRTAIITVAMLIAAPAALAQVDPAEALRELREGKPKPTIEGLQKENADLKRELAQARAEIAKLKAENARLKVKAGEVGSDAAKGDGGAEGEPQPKTWTNLRMMFKDAPKDVVTGDRLSRAQMELLEMWINENRVGDAL